MLLSALGIRVFGASELGARLPIALSAIGALMAVYWAGRSLLRPRAALLATLALGTMPLFVFEARQLTSDAPLIATLALALGAFGRFAWPPDGRRRARISRSRSSAWRWASTRAARCSASCCPCSRSWRADHRLRAAPNARSSPSPTAPARSARRAWAAT